MTIKPDNITEGTIKTGSFEIKIFRCPFEKESSGNSKFFEISLTENDHYIHLMLDQRFDWFGQIIRFERQIIDYDIMEYNHYINRKHIPMLDWKLSRYSISRLHELCELIEKKKKKKK